MASRKKTRRGAGEGDGSAQAVRDSAQRIWLAGLGAFERARTEGPKMFETLVEQGRNMGARAVGAADDVLKSVRQGDYGGRWDKLEQVFEDRVSRSLQRLGVMTSREVDELSRQVRQLNEHVRELMGAQAGGAAGRRRAGAKAKPGAKAAAGAKAKSKPRAKSKSKSKTGAKAAPKAGATRGSRARRA